MALRLRLYDMILSRLPQIIGATKGDVPRISQAVNDAQERLLNCEEANEEGWHGGWSEMAFSVSRENPYITCPRGVTRLEAIDICGQPAPLRNSFFEYLTFGDGRMPKSNRWGGLRERWGDQWGRAGYERNHSATFTDISNPPQNIQVFAVNPADVVKNSVGAIPRVLIQGLDQNGRIVTTQDGNYTVQGEFVTLESPYAMSINTFSAITGIQKDVTQGEVQIYQSDPQWGIAEILLTMEPTETTGWYPRYYIQSVPHGCCPAFRPIRVNEGAPTCGCPYERPKWAMVTALAKLDLIPVVAPTDYCLIQSKEAIIAEAQSIRMSKFDDTASQEMSVKFHNEAIKILRGQSISNEGKNNVSVNFAPFGRSRGGRFGGRGRANLQMR